MDPTEQREAVRRAQELVEEDRLLELAGRAVAIASPTGRERRLAEHLAAELAGAGLKATAQVLSPDRANAIGTLTGTGRGRSLLLYSPIDTLTAGVAAEDLPWAGRDLRADMLPDPVRSGPVLTGLGAGNPKGHVACLIAAAEAIAGAGLSLRGDLQLALCAGGMPSSGPRLADGSRAEGHFFGCREALANGLAADYAVVAKPGWNVSHEEAGYAWIEIEVQGEQAYAGSRHKLPYINPLNAAAALVPALEQWFAVHTERSATTQVRPQGVVSAIKGGRPETLAITPSLCHLWIDVRTSPVVSADEVLAMVRAVTERHTAMSGAQISARLIAEVPSVRGDPGGPLAFAAIRAWEGVSGRPHKAPTDNSGASEANLLRSAGIETVKVGMAKAPNADDFQEGMNTTDARAMRDFTNLLIALAVDLL